MMTNSSKSAYKKWLSGISLISLDQELANLEGAIERNSDDSELVNSIKEKVQVVLQEIQKRNGYSNVS
jgi:hypothetical protein